MATQKDRISLKFFSLYNKVVSSRMIVRIFYEIVILRSLSGITVIILCLQNTNICVVCFHSTMLTA